MGKQKNEQLRSHVTPLEKLRLGDPNEPYSIPGKMGKEKYDYSFGQEGEHSHAAPMKFNPITNEEEEIFIAKSAIHPRSWDDSKSEKNPQISLYIGEKAFELLWSRPGPKRRWKNVRRTWISKEKAENEGKKTGYWEYRIRTPFVKDQKYKEITDLWVPKPVVAKEFEDMKKSELKVECSNRELAVTGNKDKLIKRLNSHDKNLYYRNQGKKPHGKAYVIRREAWRILAIPRHVWRLVNTPNLIDFDVGKKKKISLRLPNLEEEIAELIMEEMVSQKRSFRDIPVTRKTLFEWLSYRNMQVDISEVKDPLEFDPESLRPIIDDLAKKNWKKLLSRWIELNAIFIHYLRSKELETITLNDPKIPVKEVQMTEEEQFDAIYKSLEKEQALETRGLAILDAQFSDFDEDENDAE